MRGTTIGLLLISGMASSAALAAASGRVVGPDGKPLQGVEVCDVLHDVTVGCIKTDAEGYYRIAKPSGPNVFVRGSGWVAKQVAAVELTEPTVLQRAASLLIHVVDADTKEPIVHGRVILNYTTGLQIGSDAPFNRSGVKISSLRPGSILARCEAEGYAPGGPDAVTLGEGEQKEVILTMKRLPDKGR